VSPDDVLLASQGCMCSGAGENGDVATTRSGQQPLRKSCS